MKTYTHNLLSAAVVAAITFSGAAIADEYQTLETTTVTAGRFEQDLMETPMSVSVITADDIAKSGAQSIGALIESMTGVRINNDGGQGIKRAKIRGEDAFRSLVMIDGQKISEQKSMSGSPILIDPAMVERIEVIKGPASVLYGSDAIGGAINIITKKGGTKPVQGEVGAGMNTSNSGKSVNASVYGGVEGWKYRIGVAHEDGDNLKTPVGDMNHTKFNSTGANLFVSYDINEKATVGATLDHFDLDFMSGSAEPGYEPFYVDVPEWKRTKLGVFGELHDLTESLKKVRFDVFYQKNDKTMNNHVEVINSPVVVDNYADNSLDQYGFSLQTNWSVSDATFIVAGYEFNNDDLDAQSHVHTVGDTPAMPTMPSMHIDTEKQGFFKGAMTTHALFASAETNLVDTVTLSYGARYTYVKTDMDDIHGYKVYNPSNTTPQRPFNPDQELGKAGKQHDDRVVFNAGLVWHPVNDLALRANWAQGFRAPLLQERYIATSMGSTSTTLGNPDLKPETSNNFEVGARWMSNSIMLDAAMFYSKAKNYIQALPISSSLSRYENVGEATTYGLELTGSYEIKSIGLEPYVNLTLMRRQFDYGNVETYKTATPAVIARYGFRWNGEANGLGLHADAYARTISKTEYQDPSATARSDSSYRLGGATTFNLTGGVTFGDQKQYGLDAGFYNIFDKAYREQTAIYEPGRYLAVKLNAKF